MDHTLSKFQSSENGSETDSLLPISLKKNSKSATKLNISGNEESVSYFELRLTDSIKWRIEEKWIGVSAAVTSSFLSSLVTVLLKYLGNYDPFVLTLWKSFGVIMFSTMFLIKTLEDNSLKILFEPIFPSSSLKWERLWTLFLLLIRGTMGISTVIFTALALRYISMGDSGVITNSHPIFVLLFALCCFDENCGIIPTLSCIASVIGVVIISKPPFLSGEEQFDWNAMMGIFFSFLCAMSHGIKFLTLRGLRHIDYTVIQMFNGGIGFIESIFLVLIFTNGNSALLPKTFGDWGFAIALTLTEFFGGVVLTNALKYEDASVVSFIQTFSVILVYFFQIILFNEFPDILSIIGAILVLSSITLAIGNKIWTQQLNELLSRFRKKLDLNF